VKKKSSTKNKKSQNQSIEQDIKQIRQSKPNKSRKISSVKTTKSFLGSGLDLDNIVLGNRQRRSVQT
jgi:hypothetical protein